MGGLGNSKLLSNNDVNLKRKNLLENNEFYKIGKKIVEGIGQSKQVLSDMYNEYKLMKSHNWKNLDDYYHCKANYNATKKGPVGETTAVVAGNYKEAIDYFKNRVRGKTYLESMDDYWHDLIVNEDGRRKAKENSNLSAQDACSDYRERNRKVPQKYW